MHLEKDPLYIEFVLNRNLKPGSIRSYKRKFIIYCQVTGLSPSQLIEEAENDEDTGQRMRKRKVKKHLQDLQDYLIGKNYSPKKIVDTITTIRGFYTHFEIQIPKRNYSYNSPDLKEEEVPNKEDIKLAIENSSLRHSVIIILMCTSGITLVDVLNLSVKDYFDSLNISTDGLDIQSLNFEEINNLEGYNIQTWKIQRQKTTTKHYTFCTPEATEYLGMYLEQNPPESIYDPLFRGNTGKQVREDVFQRYLRQLNKKLGWPIEKTYSYMHSHSFRKYFTNTMEAAGMHHHYIRQVVGHRKDPLTRAYFFTPLERLKHEYITHMSSLYFFGDVEVNVITDKKLEEMEKKMKEMEQMKKYMEDILTNPVVLNELNKSD